MVVVVVAFFVQNILSHSYHVAACLFLSASSIALAFHREFPTHSLAEIISDIVEHFHH